MRRLFIAIVLLLTLAGCYGDLDPCTFDKSVPACDLSRSKAEATIGAINADAALRATQSSIYLRAEQTKSAISADATRQVVKAEATQSAMNTEATRQAIGAAAAQSAVIYKSTQTSVDAEATKIAVNVSGAIERARFEREAIPANSIFGIAVFWFLLPALAVIGVIVFGKRTLAATTQALHKRAAMITYGPPNNPQLAFVSFDSSGRPIRFITSEGLIGPTANLLTGATVMDDMRDLPEQLKLAALVETSKRVTAARIASATGAAPWTVTRSSAVDNPAPLAVPETIAPPEAVGAPPGERVSIDAQAWDAIFKTWRPTREKMMLAFAEGGEPIYAALNDLLSGVIIGRQKQGKTTFMRFIYAQCLMINVDVRVWDLHEDVVDDLPGAAASTTAAAIKRSAVEVLGELDRRIRLRLKNGSARPLMILADEVNQLVGVVPEVVTTFERIIAEGRKYDVYCDVSAKGVPADLFGRSWVRDSVNTRVAFLTTPGQARLIGFDNDSARLVSNLTPGRAVLDGPVPAQIVTFPNVTAEHVRALVSASKATSAATSAATSMPLPVDGFMVSGEAEKAAETREKAGLEAGEIDYFDGVEAAAETAQKALVRRMMLEGKSQREMIAEIWGQTGGRGYQEAARELSAIQRELIK